MHWSELVLRIFASYALADVVFGLLHERVKRKQLFARAWSQAYLKALAQFPDQYDIAAG